MYWRPNCVFCVLFFSQFFSDFFSVFLLFWIVNNCSFHSFPATVSSSQYKYFPLRLDFLLLRPTKQLSFAGFCYPSLYSFLFPPIFCMLSLFLFCFFIVIPTLHLLLLIVMTPFYLTFTVFSQPSFGLLSLLIFCFSQCHPTLFVMHLYILILLIVMSAYILLNW